MYVIFLSDLALIFRGDRVESKRMSEQMVTWIAQEEYKSFQNIKSDLQ